MVDKKAYVNAFPAKIAWGIGQHENGKWFGWIDFGEDYYETNPYKERSSAESELLGFFNGVDIKIDEAIKELKQRLEEV